MEETYNIIHVALPCLWWLVLCKKFHENSFIFTKTGYSCTSLQICSLWEIPKRGQSNKSFPTSFDIQRFGLNTLIAMYSDSFLLIVELGRQAWVSILVSSLLHHCWSSVVRPLSILCFNISGRIRNGCGAMLYYVTWAHTSWLLVFRFVVSSYQI